MKSEAGRLGVYRVFNGMMGNGALHRIVIAESDKQAIVVALAGGMERCSGPMEAEFVIHADQTGSEGTDYDG